MGGVGARGSRSAVGLPRGGVLGFVLAGLLGASLGCSSAAGGEDAAGDLDPEEQPSPGGAAPEGAPAPLGRYQFVETPDGMVVETIGAGSVLAVSCPVRSCRGLCDECAAAACRAAGGLEAACAALSSSCLEACDCGSGARGCGFPVCAYDRQVCYLAPEGPGYLGPEGPAPDPAPELDGAASPSGRGASRPVPVP